MKLLAINGSYRRGRTIDTLMERAIEAARTARADLEVKHVFLIDRDIGYCTNCAACKDADPDLDHAPCVIHDDMDELSEDIVAADAFLFGTPVNLSSVTAVMKTFIERLVWTAGKPCPAGLLKGAPMPRVRRKRRAGIIVSTGGTPRWLRPFCDKATPMIRELSQTILNAKVVSTQWAGMILTRGVERHLAKSARLGQTLVSQNRGQSPISRPAKNG